MTFVMEQKMKTKCHAKNHPIKACVMYSMKKSSFFHLLRRHFQDRLVIYSTNKLKEMYLEKKWLAGVLDTLVRFFTILSRFSMKKVCEIPISLSKHLFLFSDNNFKILRLGSKSVTRR